MCNLPNLYHLNLPHRALSAYIYLDTKVNSAGICWPSIPTISRDLKLSESTVHRALHDLRKAKLIRTEQRYRENGGCSSQRYVLLQTSSEKTSLIEIKTNEVTYDWTWQDDGSNKGRTLEAEHTVGNKQFC